MFYAWTYKPYYWLLKDENNNSSISFTLHSTDDTTNHNIFECLHIVMASCPQMMFKLTLNQQRLFADFVIFYRKAWMLNNTSSKSWLAWNIFQKGGKKKKNQLASFVQGRSSQGMFYCGDDLCNPPFDRYLLSTYCLVHCRSLYS